MFVLPLSSQESDRKELSDWTSELLPLLLPETHVISSAMSTILPAGRGKDERQKSEFQTRNKCETSLDEFQLQNCQFCKY